MHLGRFLHFSQKVVGMTLRLLFVLVTEHTLLRIFKNIWRKLLFPRELQDAAL